MGFFRNILIATVFVGSAGNLASAQDILTAPCDLALVLAVDVSGSVDAREYRLQMVGLSEALQDGIVAQSLIRSHAAVALVQWSGTSRQLLTVPWQQMNSVDDLERFAAQIAVDRRQWVRYSTAIGEALEYSAALFDHVPECQRRVIDVSGDGPSNEGVEPRLVAAQLQSAGITVNALVIDSSDDDLTAYFWENVIAGAGAFVVTADGFDQYPERIRRKLVRETSRQLSMQ